MKTKIRRRCKCGCGRITNPGNKYILGHNRKDKKASDETKLKQSISKMGNTNSKGCKHSDEVRLNQSISQIKYNPNDLYCDVWRSREYKKDLRKDYCENKDCKGNYKRLVNHHIDLNKKNCHPKNIMTLCNSCHRILHCRLSSQKNDVLQDYLIINRKDHVSYIDKKTKKKIIIKRINHNQDD